MSARRRQSLHRDPAEAADGAGLRGLRVWRVPASRFVLWRQLFFFLHLADLLSFVLFVCVFGCLLGWLVGGLVRSVGRFGPFQVAELRARGSVARVQRQTAYVGSVLCYRGTLFWETKRKATILAGSRKKDILLSGFLWPNLEHLSLGPL